MTRTSFFKTPIPKDPFSSVRIRSGFQASLGVAPLPPMGLGEVEGTLGGGDLEECLGVWNKQLPSLCKRRIFLGTRDIITQIILSLNTAPVFLAMIESKHCATL